MGNLSFTTCMTLLEAVNVCLEAIGEQPVNSIPSSGVSEASLAYNVVNRINRDIQADGLHCNTEYAYPFVADVDGYIVVPQNVLSIDPSRPHIDCILRGNRLYNKTTRSFMFKDSPVIECDVIWFLPFEELPEHARSYIAVVAARTFQRNYLGSTSLNAMSKEDEQRVMLSFKRNEMRSDDKTFLESDGVNSALQRWR